MNHKPKNVRDLASEAWAKKGTSPPLARERKSFAYAQILANPIFTVRAFSSP
jgi:hypothetical protein